MNPKLDQLHPYPFQKLARLFEGLVPPADKSSIRLSIGEPKHQTPALIHEAICAHVDGLANYPLTRGIDELRSAIGDWLMQRFDLPENSLDPETQILPVNGTREALFSFAQTVVDPSARQKVLMPNPFYQIYEGAALLAGAEPSYLNCLEENHFVPDFDAVPESVWQSCALIYLCSPGNPTGAVIPGTAMQQLIELSDRYNFIIASDECYSEIYFDEDTPPPGLLGVAAEMGRDSYKNCVVFHSLSKRSNAPGMRSGFVAGDKEVIQRFLQYRTYHGCAMSPTLQQGSIAAWNDEQHVRDNREAYRRKFAEFRRILEPVMKTDMPDAAFYLWAKTPVNDQRFAQALYAQQHITVLPGSYLSREIKGVNPGRGYVRMALVAPVDECVEAARRIADTVAHGL
ncbi:MAG: succinyldiaminopimelate transaminase [Thiotrichales bacterium]